MPAGANPAAPLFKAAQAKCHELLPGGGQPGSEAPSAQTLARWLKISQCMRKHGISGFPDPTTSMPSKPPTGVGEIADREGAILLNAWICWVRFVFFVSRSVWNCANSSLCFAEAPSRGGSAQTPPACS